MASHAKILNEAEVIERITGAASSGEKLEISGGRTKARFGRPRNASVLDVSGLSNIVDYDPAELVLTVQAGTPLGLVRKLVADAGQMLAFEPFDAAVIWGEDSARATIGGMVAAGLSGSQRISHGAVRDHCLGFRAVSGRGEVFVAGGKVVKNVTGFDLPKLAAGSWGRLFVLSEITLKTLPAPRVSQTISLHGLSLGDAIKAMSVAMGSSCDIAAAAHCPAAETNEVAATFFRLQGFGPSVEARSKALDALLTPFGRSAVLNEGEAAALWGIVGNPSVLGADRSLWRVVVQPRHAEAFISTMQSVDTRWMLDWAGGLIWMTSDAAPDALREAARHAGGHAVLMRGSEDLRHACPALHPQPSALAALEERVRMAFDPHGVFETGRF